MVRFLAYTSGTYAANGHNTSFSWQFSIDNRFVPTTQKGSLRNELPDFILRNGFPPNRWRTSRRAPKKSGRAGGLVLQA